LAKFMNSNQFIPMQVAHLWLGSWLHPLTGFLWPFQNKAVNLRRQFGQIAFDRCIRRVRFNKHAFWIRSSCWNDVSWTHAYMSRIVKSEIIRPIQNNESTSKGCF
jgi:hypothetical protein